MSFTEHENMSSRQGGKKAKACRWQEMSGALGARGRMWR